MIYTVYTIYIQYIVVYMDAILAYYKLCGIKPKEKAANPLVNQVKPANLSIIFTKRQLQLYVRQKTDESTLTINEHIVGAGDTRDKSKAIVIE